MLLTSMFVVIAAVAGAAEPAGPVLGAVSVSVLDRSGNMVTDLRAEEVTLEEEGQPRVIKRVERDPRPLALALLLDTSGALEQGVLRTLADPVIDFLESLPAGVDRTLMTLGAPPEVLDIANPAQARTALEARVPFGKLSAYDGIAEACDRLRDKSGSRRALIVLTTHTFTEEDQLKALQAVARAMPLTLVVQFTGGGFYAPGLDAIVKRTGGRYEQIGSVTGIGKTLQKLRPELEASWLVVYETPSAGYGRKVDVKVARKGTKVRIRPAGL
jgi:hypothetical protein